MSAVAPNAGDVFSIRVIKSLVSNPLLRWANTYEIQAQSGASAASLVSALDTVVKFERALYVPSVLVEYGTVSTQVPDSKPYNGDEFLRVQYSQPGLRPAVADDNEPLQLCLRVNFTALGGRTGFRLYRGVLRETEVSSPAGTPTITDISTINTLLTNALNSSGLGDMIAFGDGGVQFVLASSAGVRTVGAVGIAGVTVKKLNNKYFNRKPATP